MRLALALLLLLIASPALAHPQLVCDTIAAETARWTQYACPLEIEPGGVWVVDFPVTLTRAPWFAILADYVRYTGPEARIEGCITYIPAYMWEDRVRYRVFSSCEGDKYLIVQLFVPRGRP